MRRLQGTADGHQTPDWTNRVTWAGAGLFVVALFVSAVLDPIIRPLHTLQSLVYVAVVVLTHMNSPWAMVLGAS